MAPCWRQIVLDIPIIVDAFPDLARYTPRMKGVIAAGDQHTAAAGAAILRAGGNAVDAAVAAAFTSFIAEIGFVHLGGSGLAQLYDPHTGQTIVYDFFSNMPGLGRPQPEHLDFHRVTIDFGGATQDFHIGRASVAVPGNIFGLCQLAADHGNLPLSTLLEPALALARDGLPLPPFQAHACQLLEPIFRHSPSMRAVFERDGRLLRGSERLFLPHLAASLQEIAALGPDSLRRGRLGRALLADQAERGGLLTPADLDQYELLRQPPLKLTYRDFDIRLPGPPSGGGALLAFALKLLDCFPIDCAPNSAIHLRLLCEVQAATQRARQRWEWERRLDPIAALANLLDETLLVEQAAAIRIALNQEHPLPAPHESSGVGNTSHLSVLDETGLAVSLTTTAGESAGFIVPGTGMIPNNMGGEADLHPQGFHVRPAGQRIPTMMTPLIVTQHGQTRFVLGSGGSERIRSACLQVLVNLLDFNLPLDQAVNNRRVHLSDGVLQCEAGYDEAALIQLEAWGYQVNRWSSRSLYFGGVHTVHRHPDGAQDAAGDDRRGGAIARV